MSIENPIAYRPWKVSCAGPASKGDSSAVNVDAMIQTWSDGRKRVSCPRINKAGNCHTGRCCYLESVSDYAIGKVSKIKPMGEGFDQVFTREASLVPEQLKEFCLDKFPNFLTILSKKEEAVLRAIFESKSPIVEYEHIIEKVWGENRGKAVGSNLEGIVRQLRKKIKEDLSPQYLKDRNIVTLRGKGFFIRKKEGELKKPNS